MVTLLLVLAAGGLGALARAEMAAMVQRRARTQRPGGTALVNLSGALLLGALAGAGSRLDVEVVHVAGTGFLGGFTTFSTWMVESVRLAEEGGRVGLGEGMVNLLGMLVVGAAAAWVGSSVVGGL
ncbi:MAG TPA: CrcB family protein [Nitriliruptorales bacterium]|nr:CrcB family protein [Nitriliruptorales bacterium]